MSAIFSDKDIAILIKEKKLLPTDYRTKIQVRPKSQKGAIKNVSWMSKVAMAVISALFSARAF